MIIGKFVKSVKFILGLSRLNIPSFIFFLESSSKFNIIIYLEIQIANEIVTTTLKVACLRLSSDLLYIIYYNLHSTGR